MPSYFVLLGPPGAGKGTQAQRITKELELAHISSGDIFRENLKNKTELGELARGYIDRGELVPDRVTISMIRDRLLRPDCKAGAILDGFPRTPAQANALSEMLKDMDGRVNAVAYIKVDENVLIQRLSGRWTCRENGHIFHYQFSPPKRAGICDFDGSMLYQREDDKKDTVANRIQVYMQQTMPLIEYYQDADLLLEIDGSKPIDEISEDLLKTLAAKVNS